MKTHTSFIEAIEGVFFRESEDTQACAPRIAPGEFYERKKASSGPVSLEATSICAMMHLVDRMTISAFVTPSHPISRLANCSRKVMPCRCRLRLSYEDSAAPGAASPVLALSKGITVHRNRYSAMPHNAVRASTRSSASRRLYQRVLCSFGRHQSSSSGSGVGSVSLRTYSI